MKEHSEPSKEETKLQSEQKTADWFLNKNTRDHDSGCEIGFNRSERDVILKSMEEYASQFKSQLPIEQKNELELIIAEKNIDIIHLRDRIKELESQPLPIEGVEREQDDQIIKFLLGETDLDGLWYGDKSNDGRQPFWWRTKLREWLATRKGSISGE